MSLLEFVFGLPYVGNILGWGLFLVVLYAVFVTVARDWRNMKYRRKPKQAEDQMPKRKLKAIDPEHNPARQIDWIKDNEP